MGDKFQLLHKIRLRIALALMGKKNYNDLMGIRKYIGDTVKSLDDKGGIDAYNKLSEILNLSGVMVKWQSVMDERVRATHQIKEGGFIFPQEALYETVKSKGFVAWLRRLLGLGGYHQIPIDHNLNSRCVVTPINKGERDERSNGC